MLDSKDNEIKKYFFSKYPEEACGILLNKRGTLEWVPCENVAEDKNNTFQIDPSTYVKCHLMGDIYAIVHSHIDMSSELSEADKKASDFLNIPYIVFSVPDFEKTVYIPKGTEDLVGRTYEFGKNDCWSLARDYYLKELNVKLPRLDFKDDWWKEGLNYFDYYFNEFGFKEVDQPEKHDIILFSIGTEVPSHCGVYLGEGIFLHHARNRLSCRESIYPLWIKNATRYARYAKS